MVTIFKGNLAPSLVDTISVNGEPFDLTTSTVKFQMREKASSVLKVDANATVTSAMDGEVLYNWQAADVDTAGEFVGWWHVTIGGTKIQDTDEFAITIRQHGPVVTSDLCNVADVKLMMEITDDSFDEGLIAELIRQASVAIMSEYEREFAPATTAATRTFQIVGNRVKLTPYDLRTVTSVQLHPETSSPITLASTDYRLTPMQPAFGVYQTLLISSFTPIVSQTMFKFGTAQIAITGNWGFASVPDPVRRACALTVQSWMRRDLVSYGNIGGMQNEPDELRPDVAGTYSIPTAARRLLSPYRRWSGVL